MAPLISLERRLDWELTKQCDLRCIHCISRMFHRHVPRELDEDEALRVVERCAEGGVTQVHFYGGEPAVRPDLPAILSRCDELGLTASFSTNGTRLGPELLGTWASLRRRRPVWVSFEDVRQAAADAIRGEGTFRAACRGARQLAEAGGEVGFVAAFTLTRPALSELEPAEILGFFAELGARHVVFQDLAVPADARPGLARLAYDGDLWLSFLERLHDPGLDRPIPFTYQLKPLVIEHLNRRLGLDLPVVYYGCNALSTVLRLLPDGTLLPCSAAVGWTDLLRRYVNEAPKLHQMDLADLLATELYTGFTACKVQREVDPQMEPCRTCHLAFRKCNPCVFGRMTGQAHRIETCAWVKEGAP